MQQNDMSTFHARILRSAPTPAERMLWDALRDRRFLGLKFRRQVPIGPFIAGFYCAEHRLVIRIDGPGHHSADGAVHDRCLAGQGIRVLRFRGDDIRANLPGCLQLIASEVAR